MGVAVMLAAVLTNDDLDTKRPLLIVVFVCLSALAFWLWAMQRMYTAASGRWCPSPRQRAPSKRRKQKRYEKLAPTAPAATGTALPTADEHEDGWEEEQEATHNEERP